MTIQRDIVDDWRARASDPPANGAYRRGAPPGMPYAWSKDHNRALAEACAEDWPRLMFDGFGIWVSPEQEEAYARLGKPGPRLAGERKNNWLSGGQRGGKTVFAFGAHIDAALYKRGVDNTDRRYWENYRYQTLAIAPTEALTLRLWQIGDEVSKGAHDSQYDRKFRRSRGGAFIGKFKAGSVRVGNTNWPAWLFSNGSIVDFRSSEGYAYRLEGGQWWFITWDEWASQPDREIRKVHTDVLYGRARDHDAKIMPMAWPKPETEHHLIAVIREIESGRDADSQVIYLSALTAPWTNQEALAVELRQKTPAEIKRTIKGEPAGGANIEFKAHVIDNMVRTELPSQELPDHDNFAYLDAWDLGATNDSTVGTTFRIPIVGGRRLVSPEFKARVVNTIELPGSDTRALPDITFAITANRMLYRSIVAVDATGMGGIFAVRELSNMDPRPYEFKSRSNDRLHGNMRIAAITNGQDCLTWGMPDPEVLEAIEASPGRYEVPSWGLVESPRILELNDQMANFDRDAKEGTPDDWVWSFLIGLWYIRRWWVVGQPGVHVQRGFDVREKATEQVIRRRRSRDQRSRLISGVSGVAPSGVRYIRPAGADKPGVRLIRPPGYEG